MDAVDGRIVAVRQEDEVEQDENDCTLTFGLSEAQYRRLRRFVACHANEAGEVLTYQAVLELALAECLQAGEGRRRN